MIGGRARRDGGYAHWFNGQGPDLEKSTVTCHHCNSVVFLDATRSVDEQTGWCMNCMKFICPRCTQQGGCTPFEQRMEQYERSRRR
jgi:hypothetical protein